MLLSRSTNKQWKNLKLSSCNIDSQGHLILCEVYVICSSTEFIFVTVHISDTNFCLESFYKVSTAFKNWQLQNLILSIDRLYDAVTMNIIIKFIAIVKENFQNNVSSDRILLLTYLPKQNKVIAVYSAPTRTRWFQWTDCKLNED